MRICLATLALTLIGCQDDPAKPPVPSKSFSSTTPMFEGEVPKNLLMISIDTWRRDHFDPHADGDIHAPFLASLANNGFLLDDHKTCSNWTYAGTTCTLLGQYNLDNGFLPKMAKDYRDPVPDDTPFLASYLKEAGFHNILVSGNSWLGTEYNNAQGYHDAEDPHTQNATQLLERGLLKLDEAVDPLTDPWFLHVHLMEPHAPYKPPDTYLDALEDLEPLPWDITENSQHYDATRDWPNLSSEEQDLLEAHLRARYAAEIRYMDDQIASFFSDLESRGLLDDTLVVVWSDHGEAFWEHGHQSHAWTLHPHENDGIAFFWAKNIVSEVWREPTVAIDLTPTLLSIFGIEVPATLTGHALGTAPEDRYRHGYSISRTDPVQSIQDGSWKLIYLWNGTVELYDLHADPDETDNLYTSDHPAARTLWEALRPRVEAATALAEEWTVTWPEGLD